MTEDPISADAVAFFREMVEPTVTEFLADPSSRRHGLLACLTLAGMTEHYFHACPDLAAGGAKALGNFKGDLRRENAALGWIADVANAAKHVHTYTGGRLSYLHVESLEMGQCGVMRCGWPFGGQEVVVGRNAEWLLSDLVECVIEFWRKRLDVQAGDG